MQDNIILLTDSYKVSHHVQYPKNTTKVFSYFESRGGKFKSTVFFGLQYFIKRYLTKPITMKDINDAASVYKEHFGTDKLFNREGWEYILREHDGFLPVRIRAVPEGSRIPTHEVLMTVENTDPKCFWLTNYLETLLSQVWYPTTVATLSRYTKDLIGSYLEKTGDPELVDFKLHDFGFRGVSSVESAGLGGAAHLVNFKGTDTIAALTFLRDYYFGGCAEGFSIPASEHSTITSWGRAHELDAYRNMIKQYGDNPLYACVSDSYDIYKACSELWGSALKDEVLNANGTLVVRPDSGKPVDVVLKCLELLGEAFGTTINSKGYKVLNPKVRVIQGDGVNYEAIHDILHFMKDEGWSADNIAFGMGGGLLQKVNRDTQKFAFKCCSATVAGKEIDVYKDPVTDPGKVSKKGRLDLVLEDGVPTTVQLRNEQDVHPHTLLRTVFDTGKVFNEQTFEEVRKASFE